jgi:hypothetical protein
MATLQAQHSQQPIHLRSLHWFGRNPLQADTLLCNADAAQIHASIGWNGEYWELGDHSGHGTRLDDQALPPNHKTPLTIGQTIRFESSGQQSWIVTNLDAPCPMLIPIGHNKAAIALHTQHLLPNSMAPQAVVQAIRNGQWQFEDRHGCVTLRDGEQIQVAGEIWQYFNAIRKKMAVHISDTSDCPPPAMQDARFNFSASQNEEHIQLTITYGRKQINLGERSHHYCLLILARQRYSDACQGFDAMSQGWISMEQMARMLGVETKQINMQLFRARTQITQAVAMPDLCSSFIERRRGELRFGGVCFQIMLGAQLEACFDPACTLRAVKKPLKAQ